MKKRIIALLLCMGLFTVPCTADYEEELSAFPAAWQTALAQLHEAYPDWVFVAVETGLPFSEAVEAETGKKSLVEKYYSPLLRNQGEGHYNPESGAYTYHDASTWVSASSAIVDYFMNPANFLNEKYIFQFEALSYDEKYHTQEGVELILKGTFMHEAKISYLTAEGETVDTEKTYSEVIMEAARESQVSPYYLASKIRTEIGITPSGSVTGAYAGYPGLYNFYNIGANDGKNPIANGLNWASLGNSYGRPWTTPEKSIINGAIWIGELYISKGQNTMYFERFNVSPKSAYKLYTHQYMTNIYGAAGQAQSTYNGYLSAGTLADAKVFYIPVFEDMPAEKTKVSFQSVQKQTGECTAASGVNLRSGPSVSHSVIGRLSGGAKVEILGGMRTDSQERMHLLENPYWFHVRQGKTEGYVSAAYIEVEPSIRMKMGETAHLLPVADAGAGVLYMENSNRNVITLSKDGAIGAKKAGTAVVRAYTAGGGMATVKITVSGVFVDMAGHWGEKAAERAADLGLFAGTSDSEFSPDISMTRAMFITVLSRLYEKMGGKIGGDISSLPYLDIDSDAWYAKAVAWAYQGGILPFGGGSMFSPSAPVTREEMAVAAQRLAAYLGKNKTASLSVGDAFSDFSLLGSESQKAVAWCVENEVLRGMGDGTLGMDKTATRAEVAQIALNLHVALTK